jgi:GDP-L-fucose synthase
MKVLVTGGGGFLGSHLVERLERDGHEVVAARQRAYDLISPADAARAFEDARPELVFHLAAEVGGIGANRANPGRYWYANLLMGANVLEQARVHAVGKVVVAGTVCSYPKHTPVPFRESDLWNGEEGDPRRRAGVP